MKAFVTFLFVIIITQLLFSQQFLTGSAYVDTREFNAISLEGQNELGPVQAYAFTDFFTSEVNSTNIVNAYGELKLATRITGPHRLLYEYNDGAGTPTHRFGYQLDVKSNWLRKIRVLPLSLNGGSVSGQVSMAIFRAKNKWAVSVFGDLNNDYHGRWSGITEVEGRLSFSKKIYLATEVELNNFGDSFKIGIALGIGVKF